VLIGDHGLTVAGVFQGPVLVVGAGQGIARSKTTKIDDELVSFEGYGRQQCKRAAISTCLKAAAATIC
jgi:hypothetical protein